MSKIDIEKILIDYKVYDLYEQVAEGKVNKNVFIKSISEMVNNLLVFTPEFDKSQIIKNCQAIINDLKTEDYNIDALIRISNVVNMMLKNSKKHSKENKSILDNIRAGNIINKEPEMILFDSYYMFNRLFYRNYFVVVGGQANSGKTSFTTDLIFDYIQKKDISDTERNRLQDTAILFYTLDDSKSTIYNKIKKQAQGRLKADAKHFVENNIFLEDYLSYDTIYLIRQKLNDLQKNFKEIIFIVDYLQLIRLPFKNWNNKKDLIDSIIYELKALATDYKMLVFCISQLNRSESGKYRYRETSEIENQADLCVDLTKKPDGTFYIDFKKNKLAESGQFFETSIDFNYIFAEPQKAKRPQIYSK